MEIIMKHTPGKWKVKQWKREKAKDGFVTVVADSRGHGLFQSTEYGESKKVEANAKLIASAPELLEALKAMTKLFEKRVPYPNNTQRYKQAIKAIAKAEGK
jgi:hypothetical protein